MYVQIGTVSLLPANGSEKVSLQPARYISVWYSCSYPILLGCAKDGGVSSKQVGLSFCKGEMTPTRCVITESMFTLI